ncbi:MAG: maleylpyruvate isomerase family mycothiol-dependent enzyme [Acidimicrobiia bacterium]
MTSDQYIATVEAEGTMLDEAATRAGLGTPIPSCPGWTIVDLLRHLGEAHRWAATIVGEARPSNLSETDWGAIRPPDDPAAAFGWFREGHTNLVATLRAAPADLDCWHFLAAPSPLAFWARRQAHELTIHRVDAELATGDPRPSTIEHAVDGIDELLSGFFGDPRRRQRFDFTATVSVETTDADEAWRLAIEPGRCVTTRVRDDADCTLRGPATDLYHLLWNRTDPDTVAVSGDAGLVDAWRRTAQIRWS